MISCTGETPRAGIGSSGSGRESPRLQGWLGPIRGSTSRRNGLTALAMAMTLVLQIVPARAGTEYILSPGDVVDFAVMGQPDLRQRGAIGPDGKLSLQLVGEIEAAGLGLSQLREKVRSIVETKLLQLRSGDGKAQMVYISGDSITLNVVEFRPIYLVGDVAKPGEFTFRPSMTVRQAIAAAGGYGTMANRFDNSAFALADLQTQRDVLLLEISREQAQRKYSAKVLKEEFKDDRGDLSVLPDELLNPEIVDSERRAIEVKTTQHANQLEVAKQAISRNFHRKAILRSQREAEEQSARLDAADSERVKELFAKNMVPISRVAEQRRIELLSTTRVLQIDVQLESVDRDRDALAARVQELSDQRQSDLANTVQEADSKLKELKRRLEATQEKLGMLSASQIGIRQTSSSLIELTIVRAAGSQSQRIAATGDTPLMPGDVVEVAIQHDQLQAQIPTRGAGVLPQVQ